MAAETELKIPPLNPSAARFAVIGTSPLLFNRMAEKAKRTLLAPKGRMTAADKAGSVKHNPLEEFRNSVYRDDTAGGPTRLALPAPAFKGAMMTAALDLPGTKRTEIGRLTWVQGFSVGIYGIPELRCDTIRMADIARTPDLRFRACLPRWAAFVDINFVRPKLTKETVSNLFAAAGLLCGVGDFRQEKGRGNNGQFRIAADDEAELLEIIAGGGRETQDLALEQPDFYDGETAELVTWWDQEMNRRGTKPEAEVDLAAE